MHLNFVRTVMYILAHMCIHVEKEPGSLPAFTSTACLCTRLSTPLRVCFSLFVFVYISKLVCICVSFSNIHSASKKTCTHLLAATDQIFSDGDAPLSPPFSVPHFFFFSLSLSTFLPLPICQMQRAKQNSGVRGLGALFKRHFWDGPTCDTGDTHRLAKQCLMCAAGKFIFKDATEKHSHLTNTRTHTLSIHKTHTTAPDMMSLMWCSKKEHAENSLESPAGTETWFCYTRTLEREYFQR